MMRHLLLAAFCIFAATAPALALSEAPTVPFTELSTRPCVSRDPAAYWLNSQAALQRIWPQGIAPTVDFRAHRVLYVHTGTVRTLMMQNGRRPYQLTRIYHVGRVLSFAHAAPPGDEISNDPASFSLYCYTHILLLPASVDATSWQFPTNMHSARIRTRR